MSERCPRCGASAKGVGENWAVYECFSGRTEETGFVEGIPCLRNQLAKAEEAHKALERAATDLAVTLRRHSSNARKRYQREMLGRDVEIADDEGNCCMETCCYVGDLLRDLLDELGIGKEAEAGE